MRWLPDALTYLRVALTLATYPVALAGWTPLFTVFVLLIVLTDVLDGPIARRLDVATAAGANLDSAADFLFYASLPIWTYALRPAVVTALFPYIVAFFIAYTAMNVASRARRGFLGFHNTWTRLAGTAGVVFALYTILWGLDPWFFRGMFVFLVLDLGQRLVAIVRAPGAAPNLAPAATPAERRE